MVIRVKPSIGQLVVINEAYIEQNPEICSAFGAIGPGEEFEILEMTTLSEDHPEVWGITSIKHTITGEVLDIKTVPELSSYWTIFEANDAIRIV